MSLRNIAFNLQGSVMETQPVRTRGPLSVQQLNWSLNSERRSLHPQQGAAGTNLLNYLKFCATLKGRADKDDRRCVASERRDEEDAAVSLPAFRPSPANRAPRLQLMDGPAVPKSWARPNTHTHTTTTSTPTIR